MGRYSSDGAIRGGKSGASPEAQLRLRAAFEAQQISTVTLVIGANTRLDQIAFSHMGDPSLWWSIAVLSKIGWPLQLPEGTRIIVPTNPDQIREIM